MRSFYFEALSRFAPANSQNRAFGQGPVLFIGHGRVPSSATQNVLMAKVRPAFATNKKREGQSRTIVERLGLPINRRLNHPFSNPQMNTSFTSRPPPAFHFPATQYSCQSFPVTQFVRAPPSCLHWLRYLRFLMLKSHLFASVSHARSQICTWPV